MDYFYYHRSPARFSHGVGWGSNGDHRPGGSVRYTYSDDDEGSSYRTDNQTAPTSGEQLKIETLDVMAKSNAVDHHTEKFDQLDRGDLIIRRGQEFTIRITLNRRFKQGWDTMKFIFKIGRNPLPGNGTLVSCTTDDVAYDGDWEADIRNISDGEVEVAIATAADCIVGEWRLSVETGRSGEGMLKYRHKKPVYILFNPWCNKDDVYFPEEEKLAEYVLNDSGCIFSGNWRQMSAMPWFFGQFEDGVLEAAIYCLARAMNFRYGRTMADPVRVSRAFSRIVNTNDDQGVLAGKWDGDYSNGRAPWSWIGSVAILRQYMKTKQPVRFGQCFTFSGLVTTICRAIGIPCRSVTNFRSAHDTDANIRIDQYHDDSLPSEQIWNFHCWNDVWMKRPDLPAGYGGWQAVDSTPQELSEGFSQCGPAPVVAILNGKCNISYDTPFVFSEVNADVVYWVPGADCEWRASKIDKSDVGRKISTKIPDGLPIHRGLSDCQRIREDITDQYKYTATEKERMTVANARRSALTPRHLYREITEEVTCQVVSQDNILIGSDFVITLVVANTGRDLRTLHGKLSCYSVTYTGVGVKRIIARNVQIAIYGGKEQHLTVPVSAGEYIDHITENAAVKICFEGRVQETQQVFVVKDDFRLRLPEIQLKVLTEVARVGHTLEVEVYLKNPLQTRNLTNCSLDIEIPGLKEQKSFRVGMLQAGKAYTGVLKLTPLRSGPKQILAVFDCMQLQDIKGIEQVMVY